MILELTLTCRNLRKVCLLLDAFERQAKHVDYYALDLSQKELERTLSQVPAFQYVKCHGLLGTYDDGKEWLAEQAGSDRHICLIHLGSSIGNFGRMEAGEFLEGFATVLKTTDTVLVGLDSSMNPDKVYHAYNDKHGITHQFIKNGLTHANDVLGEPAFHVDDWEVIGEYVYDAEGGRHQAFLSPTEETQVLDYTVQSDERIKIEQSLKYSALGAKQLWERAGLVERQVWRKTNDYGLHMLQRTNLPFRKLPAQYAPESLPTIADWEALWEVWDIVTRRMLPDAELEEKPIKLRNACIFYLGHIPTFLDIQIHKVTKLPPTEPASYYQIFERGIDPDVDNPEHCHAHSIIPDDWPPVTEILEYQNRVRQRLVSLYEGGQDNIARDIGRGIWVGFEHEVMHLETLLYMMLQSDRISPPSHRPVPDFAALAERAKKLRVENEWFHVPEQTITIGMDDDENDLTLTGPFGWDNEKPARQTTVPAFQAQGRAMTNQDYAEYLVASSIDKLPASWSTLESAAAPSSLSNGHPSPQTPLKAFIGGKAVRTVYGLIPLKYALDWPVFASYDELTGCAAYNGGRIPTLEEARSIYRYSELQKEKFNRSKLSNRVPAVNSHLVNDGVEETPPQHPAKAQVGGTSTSLYVDLSGTNTGFSHWHPQPVTALGGSLAGQAGMGGVWEWTSSALERHEGFEPMALYPAYTADFFDGKHNVVLGGSWATHPRVAGRKSFVNWYQRNYPYAWAGARVVRDI
ncbi:hypothetical protein VHEMI05890 [[Torrubiella] hemipterigena]|uniref:DUF323 domain protein n=1 Tax=[Torrubiella] hemipterigena TaxID=1531966 RepID=A0A0A1T5K2_9HYPO|nr:hypothetical protein VHEMI05890 [[Torrubiella] hemipterigena]